MKVSQLIEKLSALPPDMDVVTYMDESRVIFIDEPVVISVKLKASCMGIYVSPDSDVAVGEPIDVVLISQPPLYA